MGKHAYLITTNGNFKVLALCLRMLDDPRNDVYILFDKKARVSPQVKTELCACVKYSPVCFLDEIVINWAGYSQIQAMLNLLRAAVEAEPAYEYLHFLQGSDLLIKSRDAIHDFFTDHAGEQFVSVEKGRKAMAENKAWYRHFFCHNRYFRKNKLVKAVNFGLVWLQKLLRIRVNTDIELWQGSALFSITEACARYVLSRQEEIHCRFRFALAADEVFLQTILMASSWREAIAGIEEQTTFNARMIDRSRPDGKNSPHVWRSDEVQGLLELPAQYCFARKFDEKTDLAAAEQLCRILTQEGAR